MTARLLRAVWFVCVLTAAGLIPTSAQQDVKYVKLGGTLEVLPHVPPATEPITGVMWKHNADKAAEWDEDDGPDVDYYGPYKHRTHLNKTTFKLVVHNMSEIDDGIYSVELNGRMQRHTFKTKFIVDVPKPVVVRKPLTCTTDSESCFLVCEGNIKDAGPVTYRWNTSVNGEVKWKVTDSTQPPEQLTIFNNEEGKTIKTFSCEMKNPVGEMLSDPHENLFYVDPTQPIPVAVVFGVVFGLLTLLLLVGVLIGVKISEPFRKRIPTTVRDILFPGPLKIWFFPKDPLKPTPNASSDPAPVSAEETTALVIDGEPVAGNGVPAAAADKTRLPPEPGAALSPVPAAAADKTRLPPEPGAALSPEPAAAATATSAPAVKAPVPAPTLHVAAEADSTLSDNK